MAETKEAMVEKWLKKEGQTVTSSDNICEVSLFPSDLMVGVTSSKSGILAKILVPIGKKLSVNEPIALLVEDQAEYMEYLDATRCAEHDAEGLAEAVKVVEDKKKKPDTKVLLREIKHLIQEGHIKEDSEFARGLLSAARKSNAELMSVFEASFEGDSFDSASFDREFFLDNAVDIVDELKTKA